MGLVLDILKAIKSHMSEMKLLSITEELKECHNVRALMPKRSKINGTDH
jgi:hypothetical protein